ncbi:hypothetical protein EDD76_10142 [Kineothrix alysoides]|uniref:Uncharacterized protein n=1 Tax=Kineothrix alysoides TaxID=1469948 RepID=A0A4R1R5Z1_9FIRM|nr:hypothetical protein [Kineothrix alysoides]TCL60945.1 hypothetical protein EDD76_10142 [Kineothrix alysoides]
MQYEEILENELTLRRIELSQQGRDDELTALFAENVKQENIA